MAARLRRWQQMERNREAVLGAARRVFLERGYAGATLEAIADEAGFSKGVVYSQFGSKADLFFELLERRIRERAAQNAQIAATAGGPRGIRELLVTATIDAGAEPGWAQLLVEFRAHAARDAELNRRYAEVHARTVHGITTALRQIHEAAGLTPAIPLRSMAEFVLAAAAGITLERIADPAALRDSDVITMMTAALTRASVDTMEGSDDDHGRAADGMGAVPL
ncbi:MAG: TetR/AcrR family transcriptional regulator [Streptosporangiaceae bacterium]